MAENDDEGNASGSVDDILSGYSRRNFLRSSAKAAAWGAGAATVTYLGLDFLADEASALASTADKEIRELTLDIKAFSGEIESVIAEETAKLEAEYRDGKFRILDELGIATPEELAKVEETIINLKDIDKNYGFGERLTILKDRVDKRILGLDSKIESILPDMIRDAHDGMRIFSGKPSGTEGIEHRKTLEAELSTLCKIYDVNENNRIAQANILEHLNQNLGSMDITSFQRGLYTELKREYARGNIKDKGELKEFIGAYPVSGMNSDEMQELLEIQRSIDNLIILNTKIEEDIGHLDVLQGYLAEGIALKERIREVAPGEFRKYEAQIEGKVKTLKGAVDDYIVNLEKKGYEITTRTEYIESGVFQEKVDDVTGPIVKIGTAVVGLYALARSALSDRNKNRMRESAAKEVIQEFSERYNGVTAERDMWKAEYEALAEDRSDEGDEL